MEEKWNEMIVRSNKDVNDWREILNETKEVKKFRIVNDSDRTGVKFLVQLVNN